MSEFRISQYGYGSMNFKFLTWKPNSNTCISSSYQMSKSSVASRERLWPWTFRKRSVTTSDHWSCGHSPSLAQPWPSSSTGQQGGPTDCRLRHDTVVQEGCFIKGSILDQNLISFEILHFSFGNKLLTTLLSCGNTIKPCAWNAQWRAFVWSFTCVIHGHSGCESTLGTLVKSCHCLASFVLQHPRNYFWPRRPFLVLN